MRKAEIRQYVENRIKTPATDAIMKSSFLDSLTDEEWDYLMKVTREYEDLAAAGKIDIPEPLVG